MKKLASLAAAGAMLFVLATPALAKCPGIGCRPRMPKPEDKLTVFNMSKITNKVTTNANAGGNVISGGLLLGGTIVSGTAVADSYVGNEVNTTKVKGCNCFDDVTVFNGSTLSNAVATNANAGGNTIAGLAVGGGTIVSGDAGAVSSVTSIVNTTKVGSPLYFPVIN